MQLQVILAIIVGIVSLYFFIKRQLSLSHPVLEIRVFQSSTYTIATLLSVLVYGLKIGTQILLTFYVQNVRDILAFDTGLVLLPGALLLGFMSPVTGKIFDKVGGKGLSVY
ncbi:hypothetical protein [Bacillus sp. JJ722]|uniref:hypothetical protein n=1 Tax=Bacillus sp. JJ722 TaxID=3122973 RepID=UPI002FFEBC7F